MRAVVFKDTGEVEKVEVKDRFDFEDTFLNSLVPPPSLLGVPGNTTPAPKGSTCSSIP